MKKGVVEAHQNGRFAGSDEPKEGQAARSFDGRCLTSRDPEEWLEIVEKNAMCFL